MYLQQSLRAISCVFFRHLEVAFLGFSQGSMLAALLALQLSKPCAGLLILCGAPVALQNEGRRIHLMQARTHTIRRRHEFTFATAHRQCKKYNAYAYAYSMYF